MQVPDQTAVWADFSHIRTVKGRKVCEMIIEAPLEDLLEILKRLGNPDGADSIPVAIVPIDPKAVAAALDVKPKKAEGQASEAGGSTKPSRKWEELPYSQQAAIRCGEPAFQAFMNTTTENECAEEIRHYCNVKSRADLDDKNYEIERRHWATLDNEYQAHLTTRQYEGARHG